MVEKRLSDQGISSPEKESRHVVGYALVFETPSDHLNDFTEIIQRGALDGVIEKSDVVMTLDHNMIKGVLARSRYGEGSLKLEVDERGLRYEFDAPNTSLGNELLESLRRGDIRSSSFAFIVERDRWEWRDGKKFRIIEKIKELRDVSAVYMPAYEAASVAIVDMRGAQMLDEEIRKEEPKEDEPQPTPESEPEKREGEEEPKQEEKPAEAEPEKPAEEESKEEPEQKSAEEEEEKPNEEEEKPAEEEDKRNSDHDTLYIRSNENNSAYMPKISLTAAIRSQVGGQLTDEQRNVLAEARSRMIKDGFAIADNAIVLPISEIRAEGDTPAAPTVPTGAQGIFAATYGEPNGAATIQTNVTEVVEPLRNNLVLSQVGATILTGLRGGLKIPLMDAGDAFWESELAESKDAGQEFKSLTLKPLRVTAKIQVSKLLLSQSETSNLDSVLVRDLMAALAQKIDATLFSDGSADDTKPAGLFEGVAVDTAAIKYEDIIDIEEKLESANINNFVYVVNPSTKAALRKCRVDAGSGLFVYCDDEILGRKAIVSGNVIKNGLIALDPKELVYSIFGGNGIELIVDPYSQAARDAIVVYANIYVDVKMRRKEALVARIIKK